MRFHKYLSEASYQGNVGFEEMMVFFQKASPSDLVKMEKIVKDADWDAYKKLIKKITGKELK